MELMERVQRFKRNLDSADDPSVPWYRRKRFIFLGVLAVIVIGILLFFFGGYMAGLNAHNEKEPDKDDNEVPDPEPRVLPPLEWDGVCPKSSGKCPSSFQGTPPVIMVSLDGFRPDFMDKGFTPTIKNIQQCGTHAPFMYPVFPSKTFPNHFSQVTGLNPASHGIVDNSMYDPVRRKLFKVGQPESMNSYWWLKDPIWVTAEKQGKKTACFFWPGSDVKINGYLPTYFKKYKSKTPFESRVDQILAWLDLPVDSRPHFLTLYVNQPDNALHHFGTQAKEVNDALAKVDRMIERLFSGLQQRNLLNCVNIMIMSDHGMSDTDCKRVIDIQNFMNANDTYNTVGPFGRLRPRGKYNATQNQEIVSKLACKNNHMRAYTKEQLPVRLHFADNYRIEPIFLDIDAGWTVISKSGGDGICSGGAHGYDNMFQDMRAIFLAHGPSFKKNFTMQPFINTEIYEMLTELINISPNPNNGTRGSMHYIMTSPKPLPPQKEPESPAVGSVPSDEMYNDRISASGCSCPESPKQEEMQSMDITAARDLHLPFGIPHSAKSSSSLLLLYNENYVSAFNLKYKIPLWSSFTIKNQGEYNLMEDLCWKGDARIPVEKMIKCDDYNTVTGRNSDVLPRPLYPPGFSNGNRDAATFITNSVVKSLNHTKIIEKKMNQILKKWTSETGDLNVVTGPAFDIFATGVRPESKELEKMLDKHGPLLIPTHIFVVTTWCTLKSESLKSCDPSRLKSNAFLLPNKPFPMNCEVPEKMISKNVARVVDVEKLTGISFYTGLPIYDAIRLRTNMPERSL